MGYRGRSMMPNYNHNNFQPYSRNYSNQKNFTNQSANATTTKEADESKKDDKNNTTEEEKKTDETNETKNADETKEETKTTENQKEKSVKPDKLNSITNKMSNVTVLNNNNKEASTEKKQEEKSLIEIVSKHEKRCTICDVVFNGPCEASHLQGKKHRMLIQQKALYGNNVIISNKRKRKAANQEKYRCEICDMDFSSVQHRDSHIIGKKHQKQIRLNKNNPNVLVGKPKLNTNTNTATPNTTNPIKLNPTQEMPKKKLKTNDAQNIISQVYTYDNKQQQPPAIDYLKDNSKINNKQLNNSNVSMPNRYNYRNGNNRGMTAGMPRNRGGFRGGMRTTITQVPQYPPYPGNNNFRASFPRSGNMRSGGNHMGSRFVPMSRGARANMNSRLNSSQMNGSRMHSNRINRNIRGDGGMALNRPNMRSRGNGGMNHINMRARNRMNTNINRNNNQQMQPPPPPPRNMPKHNNNNNNNKNNQQMNMMNQYGNMFTANPYYFNNPQFLQQAAVAANLQRQQQQTMQTLIKNNTNTNQKKNNRNKKKKNNNNSAAASQKKKKEEYELLQADVEKTYEQYTKVAQDGKQKEAQQIYSLYQKKYKMYIDAYNRFAANLKKNKNSTR